MYGLSDDVLLDSTKILGDNFRIHHNYFEGFYKDEEGLYDIALAS